MDEKVILLILAIIIIGYFVYKKYYSESFTSAGGDIQMNGNLQHRLASNRPRKGESFTSAGGDIQMNGNLQHRLASTGRNYEQFDSPQNYESSDSQYNDLTGGQFVEYVRDVIDPDLAARQKNFVSKLNDGKYDKAVSSSTYTARYQTREAQAADFIGLRAPRMVPQDENQKVVHEITMDSGYADEDTIFGAKIITQDNLGY